VEDRRRRGQDDLRGDVPAGLLLGDIPDLAEHRLPVRRQPDGDVLDESRSGTGDVEGEHHDGDQVQDHGQQRPDPPEESAGETSASDWI